MKKVIAIIITVITLCAIATATAEVGDRGEFYPRLAVVTSFEQIGNSDLWLIVCTDKDGEQWMFYGEEEDAHIGYIFNLLMWNMGEAEENDEIVEVYYEGCMNKQALTAWLKGEWQ